MHRPNLPRLLVLPALVALAFAISACSSGGATPTPPVKFPEKGTVAVTLWVAGPIEFEIWEQSIVLDINSRFNLDKSSKDECTGKIKVAKNEEILCKATITSKNLQIGESATLRTLWAPVGAKNPHVHNTTIFR